MALIVKTVLVTVSVIVALGFCMQLRDDINWYYTKTH